MRHLFILCASLLLFHASAESLPPVAMASVKTASIQLPVIRLAAVPLPEIKLPAIKTVFIISSDWSDSTEVASTIASVPIAKIADTADQIATAKIHREIKKRLFRDQRNLQYDSTTIPKGADFAAWLELYNTHQPYTLAHIPLQKGLRMIAELRLPVKEKILADNLEFYKNQGYTAVLITFDGSEEPYQLAELADKVTTAGMRPWYAFGGAENLKLSVFVHPYKLKRLICALAPKCDGTLLHWRRTSQHLLLPDAAFVDFFLREGRSANPNLQIVGESYFGHNALSEHKLTVATNVPTNASGVLLVNVGHSGINAEGVLNRLFGHLRHSPRLVLILGDRPYYATKNYNALDFGQNLLAKQRVGERFLAAGAAGTVTLHGDGSNGLYNRNHTDNLGATSR